MNKTELIAAIAEKAELTKKDSDAAVNAIFETISTALAGGDKVQLAGFGTFEVRERPARTGRNPQTKEEIEIPAWPQPADERGDRDPRFPYRRFQGRQGSEGCCRKIIGNQIMGMWRLENSYVPIIYKTHCVFVLLNLL